MVPQLALDEFEGYILDWDGVIAETSLNFQPIRDRFFGGRHASLLEEMALLDEPERSQCREAIEAEELRGACAAQIVPGASDLLGWLVRQGKKYAVLSRNSRSSLDRSAANIGVTLPPVTVTREAPHVKPDPRALWDVCDLLDVRSQDCLVVGDYVYELLAARRACMRAALVQKNGPWASWADAVYPRLTDFVRALGERETFVPWEYHGAEVGSEFVRAGDLTSLEGWLSLERAAASGAREVRVPVGLLAEPMWRACPGLPAGLAGLSVKDAVQLWLGGRWPLLSVTEEQNDD
ncbi:MULTISPECIES: HAD family hydrolase [Jonquetella]|uniref:Putative phosphatase/phosphohexomutase n=1 Tax=Jonquetella anthropi DSM 22815 TaxID=885272 RepID=H0ULN8_9BACT|nr:MULTISPECIES: HAD hydrolase-like protein [Jonquetella]EEX49244.1 HAD hydrolase, family IA, variant 3 [Jonquetella anthropi E3_33 E1]EHM12503.1 putative phosphatase/phosphohexomutase [Jonquetella anthropi DSM 22815]ERL24815.1 haloacid dehalogenase-like hydrolase [Jonquetella sp. BV3C21]